MRKETQESYKVLMYNILHAFITFNIDKALLYITILTFRAMLTFGFAFS